MPLDLNRYTIALARDGLDLDKALAAGEGDGYDLHTVTVLHADQLVAEQAGPRYGLMALGEDGAQKMAWATLWVWCALRRMRVDVPEFPPFKARVLDMEALTQATDTTPEADAVDPTGPPPDTGSV